MKEFAKTKQVVQAWSKMFKNKETIHAYLMSMYIGSILRTFALTIMQTSSIMHFYICFGLCWHQSPKRGD
jgi:riboflavin transporter FmnP